MPISTRSYCKYEVHIDRWKEKVVQYGSTENVMRDAKLFYQDLVDEPNMTDGAVSRFSALQEYAREYDTIRPLVEEMNDDVLIKKLFSECLYL